jgi:hypothetical protein
MKLEILKESQPQNAPKKKQSVVIDPNPKRIRVTLDANGNEVDMRTKQIINKAQE